MEFTSTFANVAIDELTAFTQAYISQVAEAARVMEAQVRVLDIISGSIVIHTEVDYATSSLEDSERKAKDFIQLLEDEPEVVAPEGTDVEVLNITMHVRGSPEHSADASDSNSGGTDNTMIIMGGVGVGAIMLVAGAVYLFYQRRSGDHNQAMHTNPHTWGNVDEEEQLQYRPPGSWMLRPESPVKPSMASSSGAGSSGAVHGGAHGSLIMPHTEAPGMAQLSRVPDEVSPVQSFTETDAEVELAGSILKGISNEPDDKDFKAAISNQRAAQLQKKKGERGHTPPAKHNTWM